MLHTEQQHEPQTSPAQIRVKPEELARALAAVEARREQSAREAAGTIPIADAVQQLGFDVTPEEIWAEVQAGRVREAGRRGGPRRRRRLWPAAGLVLLTLGGLQSARMHSNASNAVPAQQDQPVTEPPVKQPNVNNQNIRVTEHTPSGPLVELLSEVPDGHLVHCTYDDASKITPGYLARSYGSPMPAPGFTDNNLWTLLKYNGRVYLRGWSPTRVSRGALGTVGVTVFNTSGAAGAHAVPVTLRIGDFDSAVTQGVFSADAEAGSEAITVTNIHPDAHLWEKP